MIVVFPVCDKDIELALLHAKWLKQMAHKNPMAIVLSEDGCGRRLQQELLHSFSIVHVIDYARLEFRWPETANRVFQMAARTMTHFCQPWLFMEADAIAMRPDWLNIMEQEYQRGGKPFMGPVVDGMSHPNGSMVYPPNAHELIPESMQAVDHAWDMVCGTETVPHLNHDSRAVSQLVWCVDNGVWRECGSGQVPSGVTVVQARKNVRKGIAMLHRIKDDSLLNLLISGKFKP